MQIRTLSVEQAVGFLLAFGFNVPFFPMLGSCLMKNKDFQCQVCDYTKLDGYEIDYAVSILDKDGKLLERFNVKD